ncbi:MAG: Hsp20/alpha crystallin family protein [Phycisphaerae bacterium]|nr:Hsp20/alpha crystallin family protein [Phycisphaerae bacterium]
MSPIHLDATEDSFASIARQMSRMLEAGPSGQYVPFSRREFWTPAVNLYETATHFVICAELAGVPRETIDVKAEPGRIVIHGERHDPYPANPDEPHCVHAMEIDLGAFYREVQVPGPMDIERIQAKYRDGLLWIHVPKQRV